MNSTKRRKSLFSCCFGRKSKKKVLPEEETEGNQEFRHRNTLIESNLAKNHSNLNEMLSKRNNSTIPRRGIKAKCLLPPSKESDKKTLILDLDETCAHSSFSEFKNSNFKQRIVYEGIPYTIHVLKRPHLQEFLKRMSKLYEIIFYTASVREYADLVLDYIDPEDIGSARLFREDCRHIEGSFVKDLSNLGRDLKKTVIIDNSPIAYCLNPNNGLPIKSFYDDINDEELLHMIPVLEHLDTVDNIQEFIEEQMLNIASNCNWVAPSPKRTASITKEPTNDEKSITRNMKYSSPEVEDFKENIGACDDELKLEDISEGNTNNDQDSKVLEKYDFSSLSKPKGMLARYNELSAVRRPTDEIKEATEDAYQIGQGSQTEDNFTSGITPNLKHQHISSENLRYNQVSLKNTIEHNLKTRVKSPDDAQFRLSKIVQNSLNGLNNERVLHKCGKIREKMSKDTDKKLTQKSLVEILSNSASTNIVGVTRSVDDKTKKHEKRESVIQNLLKKDTGNNNLNRATESEAERGKDGEEEKTIEEDVPTKVNFNIDNKLANFDKFGAFKPLSKEHTYQKNKNNLDIMEIKQIET
ncbi:unnamed protein product [Moneuplotes crassus]|uniref:FCP1 homology domain-containing protein n=1 Tax=Euplotes crassus TaxID=5936 RepID=A0AAD1UBZ9_EUPCR|nr:unnamed protein product [Moneuplotes crassus]